MSLYLTDRTAYWRKMKKKQRKRYRKKQKALNRLVTASLSLQDPSPMPPHSSSSTTAPDMVRSEAASVDIRSKNPTSPSLESSSNLDDLLKEIESL